MRRGEAEAPGAATVINAIATLKGSAFAVDLYTSAEVVVGGDGGVTGEIEDKPDADTSLIERCAELVLERFDVDDGAHVTTSSDVPMASGLKSSSAAANATVLATLDAIGESEGFDRREATRIGVEAARDAGVTITGAIDDAAASMLGGVVLTDNSEDEIIRREEANWDVAVYVPDETAKSADTDVERSRLVGSVVDRAFEVARDGEYADAMTINGLAYSAALGFDPSVAVDALEHVDGAGLSGTGPSYAAIGDRQDIKEVVKEWEKHPGTVLEVETDNDGARVV
ncbi:shikimate kinase [Halorutilales archaeon Cl-col2-1]